MPSETNQLAVTLSEREQRYGLFADNAHMSQLIKQRYRQSPNWNRLTPTQQEALDQIACKISRIFSGDPDYTDNWHDIAGYAKLAEEEIHVRKEATRPRPMQVPSL